MAESLTNVAVGYGVAVSAQIMVFPLFGLDVALVDNLAIGAIFIRRPMLPTSAFISPV